MRKSQAGLKKSAFIEAAQAMGTEKGVSEEALLAALVESFRVTFAKKIEDEFRIDRPNGKSKVKDVVKLPDALIRTEIDLKKGKIEVFHQWLVVNDDDVQDDYIEIGLEDAKEKNPKLKVGDYYEEELDFNALNKVDVNRFVSCFRQKISKAEKDALLASFENKIGKIVTADVEKFDDKKVLIVNLGKTSASLYKSDLIGDEKFSQGDKIKVFVVGFEKDEKKGLTLKVSRSCDGFLRCLFEEEIHEIYDGTVLIKDVKRLPGKRSKVAVYSNDPNVDPSGACIGQNGTRIQNIVSQLGNGGKEKEKIDVITWSPNLGLYLAEILKPAKVLGININEETKSATVVCEDGTGTFAIGFKGANVYLAKKLTDLNEIKVLDEHQALEEGIVYKPIEEYEIEAKEEERRRFRERQQKLLARVSLMNPSLDEQPATEEVEAPEVESSVEELQVEETPVVEEVKVEETPVVEEKVEVVKEEPVKVQVEEKPVEEVEKRTVKTTTTLESLEKLLDEEKKSSEKKSSSKKKYKKDDKKSADSEQNADNQERKPVTKMDIYTEEELQQLDEELEDLESYEEEEDYSEYDSDDYYEE